MKKVVFLMMLLPATIMAQDRAMFAPGLKAGVISTTNNGWKNYGAGITIGATYGLFFKKIYVSVEPSYAMRGLRNDGLFNNLNYLEMPILFGYTPFNNKLRLGVNAGISPSYMTHALDKERDESNINFKKFNLDGIGGGIIGYHISSEFMVDLNIRYGRSIVGENYSYLSAFINFIFKVN